MTNYSTVQNSEKTELPDTDQSVAANAARAAVRNVVDGGMDSTGGARFWDGTDFLVWESNSPNGTPHNKFEEYSSITIPAPIFNIYPASTQRRYSGGTVRYGEVRYPLPADVLTIPQTGCRESPFHLFRFQIYSVTSVSFDTSPTARDGGFMRRTVTDCRFLEIGLG